MTGTYSVSQSHSKSQPQPSSNSTSSTNPGLNSLNGLIGSTPENGASVTSPYFHQIVHDLLQNTHDGPVEPKFVSSFPRSANTMISLLLAEGASSMSAPGNPAARLLLGTNSAMSGATATRVDDILREWHQYWTCLGPLGEDQVVDAGVLPMLVKEACLVACRRFQAFGAEEHTSPFDSRLEKLHLIATEMIQNHNSPSLFLQSMLSQD